MVRSLTWKSNGHQHPAAELLLHPQLLVKLCLEFQTEGLKMCLLSKSLLYGVVVQGKLLEQPLCRVIISSIILAGDVNES